jgi:hypothetical protein
MKKSKTPKPAGKLLEIDNNRVMGQCRLRGGARVLSVTLQNEAFRGLF